MRNTISSEEEDEPVNDPQPQSSRKKPGTLKKFSNLANHAVINRRTNKTDMYFLDFTPHPDAIRFLPKTNQLQVDIYPDMDKNTRRPKDIMPPGTKQIGFELCVDKDTQFVRFNLDCRLFNDAGPLNDAIKQVMRDAGKGEILCEDPNCYFVLYGANFKIYLIVFKLPGEKISNLKSVFKRYEGNDSEFDEDHIQRWLNKQFQAFKLHSKKGGKKVEHRKFLELQLGNNLENVDKNELDQLIGTREITDYYFDIYKNVYRQASEPTEDLYRLAQIVKTSDPRQELDRLFSYGNFVFDGNNENEHLETDIKTFSKLWIASSHNSYLDNRQVFHKARALAYIKILLTGCRCIELDLWPLDDKIIVTHGSSFTAPVSFETILDVIKTYAFEASKYPLILSLEDHCGLDKQKEMARMFRQCFGDLLLTKELEPKGTAPELHRLMGKILIKHSALDDREREQFLMLSNDILEAGIFDVKYAQNDIWRKRRVILYNNRIEISEVQELLKAQLEAIAKKPPDQRRPEEQAALDEAKRKERDVQELVKEMSTLNIEELPLVCETDPATAHLSQPWYHGVLDAKDANARLNAAKNQVPSGQSPDGIFTIHRMSQNSDEYVLSVIHQGRPKPAVIHYGPDDRGQKVFTIGNQEETYKSNKLTDLVDHYHKNKLKIGASSPDVRLRQACRRPVQTLTEQEPRPRWFFPNMSHARAHFLLQAYPEGTCLVRTDESFNQGGYILTVRLRYIIQHFRLKQDGETFYVNSSAFNSIEEVIEYFRLHPFVDGIRLEPIDVDDMTNQKVDEMMEQYNERIFYQGEYYEGPIPMRTYSSFSAHTLFGQCVKIPRDQLITKIKGTPTLVMFDWNFQFYFINPEQEVFRAERFDPNEPQVFGLNSTCVKDKLEEEVERQGFEFRYETTYNEEPFSFAYVRFTESNEDYNRWIGRIRDQIRQTEKMYLTRDEDLDPSKGDPVDKEMSDLAVYFKTFDFEQLKGAKFPCYNKVCSIEHGEFLKFHKEKALNEHNSDKVTRIYPEAENILSGNYDPIECWNAGCQMVALNYQTDDVHMLQNYARFLANGGCGYVAKPDYLKTPITAEETANRAPTYLTIKVIGGRNLTRLFEQSSGICSPMVEFWLDEVRSDQDYKKTKGNRSNGLNPVWKDQNVTFQIRYPELALIRLQVIDADYIGWIGLNWNYHGFWKWKSPIRTQFVGQAAFPFKGLQTGIRSVPLLNNFNKHLELSSLLVEIEISDKKPSERQPSKLIGKGRRLGTSSKQPEPMEIDPDQPGPSGTSF